MSYGANDDNDDGDDEWLSPLDHLDLFWVQASNLLTHRTTATAVS